MVYPVAYYEKINWNLLFYWLDAHKTYLTHDLCQFFHFSDFFNSEAYIMALMHSNTNKVEL